MHCCKCNKPITDGEIFERDGVVHVIARCHGKVNRRTFTQQQLKDMVASGQDLEKLRMFDFDHLVPKEKDPESMTTLKHKLKTVLNDLVPGWYRGELPWSDQVVKVVRESIMAARSGASEQLKQELAAAKADLNQLMGMMENCLDELDQRATTEGTARQASLKIRRTLYGAVKKAVENRK